MSHNVQTKIGRKVQLFINLRHLHLEGCRELKYMPRGMGQLRNLKTLSMFLIGKESEGGLDLDEIKELEIRGYLKIKNVERVSDACIARGISMSKMSRINELELYWNDGASNDEKKSRHEKIGEALEVSSRCVWRLKMKGYKGENMPKWVGESCASSLKRLELREMENVQHIFTMNTSSEIGMVDQLFPLLKELDILNMRNLRELVVSPPPPIPPVAGAFPSLREIRILDCPNLGALPPRLKSLEGVTLCRDCCDELLESIISNNQSLTSLCIWGMDERRVLFPGAAINNNNKDEASLMIDDDEDEITRRLAADNINEAQAGEAISTFQSLRELDIRGCRKLRCLFDEEECEELATAAAGAERERERERRRRGGLITNLVYLHISSCPELRISVEQWRNLIIAPSLQYIFIDKCPKVVPSKGEEADQVIALLRSLRSRIRSDRFDVDFLRETGTS